MGLTHGWQITAFSRGSLHFIHDVLRFVVSLGNPVEVGNLADNRRHLGVFRCRGERVAPAQRRTKRRHAPGIDVG